MNHNLTLIDAQLCPLVFVNYVYKYVLTAKSIYYIILCLYILPEKETLFVVLYR